MSPCSQCGDTLVRLASGADECPICEDICPTCSELRYGPDTPQTCSLDSDTRDLPTATTVIHLRDAPDGWRTDARYVYIGRASRRAGLPESKWHNPFPLRREDDRAAVIVQFSAYLDTRPDLLAALPELRGKILVCWCAPKACHGDVLAQRVNALPPDESALTSVFARHDRSACLEEREPAYAPVTRAGGLAATVETCYGRQVVLRFDVAPDLREGQAVRVMVEA